VYIPGMDFGVVFTIVCIAVVVGFYLTMFLLSKKIVRAPWFVTFSDRLLKVVAVALAFGFVVVLGKAVVESAWIPHTKDVLVSVDTRNWIPEEVKMCALAKADEKKEPMALICYDGDNDSNSGQSHIVKVKFWGSIQADKNKLWKCTRGQATLRDA
jgi:hypothetical protein